MADDKLLIAITKWFEHQGWRIETAEQHRVLAVMSSDYGSGPTVVDITDLLETSRAAIEQER